MPPASLEVILERVTNLQTNVAKLETDIQASFAKLETSVSTTQNTLSQLALDNDRNKNDIARLKQTWDEWRKTLVGVAVTLVLSFGGLCWLLLTGGAKIVAAKP